MTQLGIVLLGGGIADVVEVTRQAEAAGFASVWTTEFYERTATISLAAMASVSERVLIGSAIAYGVGRSPLVLSAEARDIDEMSGGRLILGLGTGTRTMQRDWHGTDPEAPAPRMEELIPLLRRFWSIDQDGVHHDGRFYHVALSPTTDVRPPLRADIPVYLAGVNARMIQAAGAVADGLVGHPIFTRRYVEEVARPAIARGATANDRAAEDVALAGYVICSVHDDVEVARREARAQIAFYSIVKTYDAIVALHGFREQAAAAREAWKRRDRDGMIDAIPDEMVDLMAITGPPEEARQRLTEVFGGLYDHTLLYSPSFGLSAGRFRENLQAIVDTFGPSRS